MKGQIGISKIITEECTKKPSPILLKDNIEASWKRGNFTNETSTLYTYGTGKIHNETSACYTYGNIVFSRSRRWRPNGPRQGLQA